MPELALLIGVWTLLIGAAAFYALRARHPGTKPLAATLIFVTVFSAAALVLLFSVSWLARWLGLTGWLERPLGTIAFLLIVFGPAFLLARWQIRRPPRRMPPID